MRKFLLSMTAVAALVFVSATPRQANAQSYYSPAYTTYPAYAYPTYNYNLYYSLGNMPPRTTYQAYTPTYGYVTPSYSYVTPSYSYVTPAYVYPDVGVGPVWYGGGYHGGWRGRYWRR